MSMIRLDDEGNPFVTFQGKGSLCIVVKRRLVDDHYQINAIQDATRLHNVDKIRKHTVFKDDGMLWLRFEMSEMGMAAISDAVAILRNYKPPKEQENEDKGGEQQTLF